MSVFVIKFKGDELIKDNHDVALVHDLWDKDKHARLDRPPRSDINATLVNLKQKLQLLRLALKVVSRRFQLIPNLANLK